jgi:hypothetical protein
MLLSRGFIHVKILEWNVNKSASRLYVYAPRWSSTTFSSLPAFDVWASNKYSHLSAPTFTYFNNTITYLFFVLFRLKEHRYSPYSLPSPPASASPSPQPAVNTSIQTDDIILSDTSPLRASSADQPSSQSESVINVTHPLIGATTALSVTSPLSGPLPPLGVPLPPSRHFLSHLNVGAPPPNLLQPTFQPWDKRVKVSVSIEMDLAESDIYRKAFIKERGAGEF